MLRYQSKLVLRTIDRPDNLLTHRSDHLRYTRLRWTLYRRAQRRIRRSVRWSRRFCDPSNIGKAGPVVPDIVNFLEDIVDAREDVNEADERDGIVTGETDDVAGVNRH